MAKAIWQGYIAIGQLGIPVRLFAAVQASGPRFVQLHAKDQSPVTRELQCRDEHKPISPDEVVRAVEYEPGRYIALSDQELAKSTGDTVKTLAVQQFADIDAIPPEYYEKPYYIVPAAGGEAGYSLLRETFSRTHNVAIVSFVLYTKAHMGIIQQIGDMLVLLQLRFPTELVPRSSIKTPPLTKPTPQEIDIMAEVVERYRGPVYMHDYHDEYAERISELVARKAKGLPEPRRSRTPRATPESEIIPTLQRALLEGPKLLGDNQP